ncbi:MAG: hypothetical protein H6836_00910 [Planctomycetes bacterium]|nr:hypothetical protein [Planctomycetota bacterium]MCB9888102.1 hypothetical protein [Planctomycetota bacterium]
MPAYRKVLIPGLLASAFGISYREPLVEWVRSLRPASCSVVLIDDADQPVVPRGRIDVFELDRSSHLPSPAPLLGSIALSGEAPGEEIEIDSRRFPPSIQLRFHVPGFGVDYRSVELATDRTYRMQLSEPVTVRGCVRNAHQPLAGARVLALGGGPRGVLLAEARTDADGCYRLVGIARAAKWFTFRVLLPGYTMCERDYRLEAKDREAGDRDFYLDPVPPVCGVVHGPSDLPLDGLEVGALVLGGLRAAVATDGSFELHHLRAGQGVRLLVRGLPPEFTQRAVRAAAGERVVIEVCRRAELRGKVVSRQARFGLGGVEVWHDDSDRGTEMVRTDASGNFQLQHAPTGSLVLHFAVPAGPRFPQGRVLRREVVAGVGSELVVPID